MHYTPIILLLWSNYDPKCNHNFGLRYSVGLSGFSFTGSNNELEFGILISVLILRHYIGLPCLQDGPKNPSGQSQIPWRLHLPSLAQGGSHSEEGPDN